MGQKGFSAVGSLFSDRLLVLLTQSMFPSCHSWQEGNRYCLLHTEEVFIGPNLSRTLNHRN